MLMHRHNQTLDTKMSITWFTHQVSFLHVLLNIKAFSNAELRGHVCAVQVEPEQDLQLRDQAGLWDGLRHLLLVHSPTQLHGDRPVLLQCNRCYNMFLSNEMLHRHTRENHLHEPDWGQWFMNVPKVKLFGNENFVTKRFYACKIWHSLCLGF